MFNLLKNNGYYCLFILLVLVTLSACGSSSSSSTPTSVPNAATIFYAHNLVFRNSTTLSSGYNGFGQLGTGNLGSRNVSGTLDKYYPFAGTSAGGNHSVAFTNNSSAVYSWGYNGFGQLGNSSTTYSSVPVRSGTITGVTAVAAGAYHTLALKNDDTLWAWGSNGVGQLGVDSVSTASGYSTVPLRVNAAGIAFSNISTIAANGYNSLALANGKVWAWGYNGTGQLGIDPATTGAAASPTPVSGLPAVGISAIAAGSAFNYAVAKDGTLWAWGNNSNGQLGNGTTISSYTPVQVFTAAGTPLTDVVQVAGGIQHGLARLGNGTVWAWGYNFFGQLGNNGKLDSSYAVQVITDVNGTPLSGVSDIRAFGSSSMAKVGNAWYVWGDNAYGQLGIGSSGNQSTIVPLPVRMSGF